jgi:hypothetical protein
MQGPSAEERKPLTFENLVIDPLCAGIERRGRIASKHLVGYGRFSSFTTVNTVPKQLRPFRPGQSGNPNGRPKGSRNATTLALESLLDGQAKALTQKAIDLALAGDLIALRICLDRILPVRKNRPVEFGMPAITTIGDAPNAMAAITRAVAEGEITATDAADVSRLVETYVRAIEASDLDTRLKALEEAMKCERGR